MLNKFIFLSFSLFQKSTQELHKLSIQQASICISEPPDSPLNESLAFTTQQSINSPTPSPPPPPPISIVSPCTPPISPNSQSDLTSHQLSQLNGEDEKQTLLASNNVNSNIPATIVEHEESIGSGRNRSSLSLPFEQSPTSPSPSLTATNANNNHVNGNNSLVNNSTAKATACERSQSDRRKLSVSNIISFGEQRRRSTSSIFSDMRKMSITNFDSIKSPGVGESSITVLLTSNDLLSSRDYVMIFVVGLLFIWW